MALRTFLAALLLFSIQLTQALTLDQCGPLYTTPKTVCQQRASLCRQQFNVTIKWTGRGCLGKNKLLLGDGGCQCDQYCGYHCKGPCNSDKECTWKNGACYNRKTNTRGVPILICPPIGGPTLSPSGSLPSQAPTGTLAPSSPTTSLPSQTPSHTPTTSKPSKSPSRNPQSSHPSHVPSIAPKTSRPSNVPSKRPSTSRPSHAPSIAPKTSRPSNVPSKSPSTSRPSHAPSIAPKTSRPSNVPSKSPSTSRPSRSPSTRPTTASPSKTPSKSPSTSRPSRSPSRVPSRVPSTSKPSHSPSKNPSGAPSTAPSCVMSHYADVIWVLDSSTSMANNPPDFPELTDFAVDYTNRIVMGPSNIRQGFVSFAGPGFIDPSFQTINNVSNLTDASGTDSSLFINLLDSLVAIGGSTDQAGALDYVRINMFTPENARAGAPRIVVFASDGGPTDYYGNDADPTTTENAAALLKSEDNVIFVFLRLEDPNLYPANFLVDQADYTYDSTFAALPELLNLGFLCLPPGPG